MINKASTLRLTHLSCLTPVVLFYLFIFYLYYKLFGEISDSHGGKCEDVFWDVVPCSLIEMMDIFYVLTASIIRASSPLKYQSIC
jgi:hypothetical protein